jgi:hypothetical protein
VEFQQQVLLFLTQVSDQILLHTGVHEGAPHLSCARQVAPDWTEGKKHSLVWGISKVQLHLL